MLTWILLGLGAAVALVLLVILLLAAGKPSTFRIERRTEVGAPPATVFAHLEDLRRWRGWSPWEGLDPNLERTYDGAERGVGASYAWKGNKKAGAGRMTITDSRPGERLELRLQFTAPFAATHTTTFTLVPNPAGTEVRWLMEGKNGFGSKVFAVFVDLDALIGKDFEKGLASLRGVAESA
ncbi:MAG: SRPBCC family protein [Kofleriaceae bacterium]|jgi:uncharacterized protein YndB with AHSA1/START domain|nr:SRPBCC family protein [Kofleriaceae bacterium]MBP6838539.1 SRPBCC family protein [Kofleriaceae bacterium]MBP9207651.1 SRPBCC family protein [Kofleriaceae bacterium]